MTIAVQRIKTEKMVANGYNYNWPFKFKIWPEDSVKLIVSTEDTEEEISSEDYTLTLIKEGEKGGVVVYPLTGEPLARGYYVTILKDMTFNQTTEYTNDEPFDSEAVEKNLDRLTAMAQILKEETTRMVKTSITDDPIVVSEIEDLIESSQAFLDEINSFKATQASSGSTNIGLIQGHLDDINTALSELTALSATVASYISQNSGRGLNYRGTELIKENITSEDNTTLSPSTDYGRNIVIESTVTADVNFTIDTLSASDDGKVFHFTKYNANTYRVLISPPTGIKCGPATNDYGIEMYEKGYISLKYDHTRLKLDIVRSSLTSQVENFDFQVPMSAITDGITDGSLDGSTEYVLGSPYLKAKSVICDFANNWGGTVLGIRSIDFYRNGSIISMPGSNFSAYATSYYGSAFYPSFSFDTTKSKTGSTAQTQWFAANGVTTNQRLIIVFNSEISFDRIVINNSHDGAAFQNQGVRNTNIYVTTDTYTNTSYGANVPNSSLFLSEAIPQHVSADVVDNEIYDADPLSVDTVVYGNLSIYTFNGNLFMFYEGSHTRFEKYYQKAYDTLISLTIVPQDVSQDCTLINMETSGFILGIDGTTGELYIELTSGTLDSVIKTLVDATKYKIDIVKDGGDLKVYVNNVLELTVLAASWTDSASSTSRVTFGIDYIGYMYNLAMCELNAPLMMRDKLYLYEL